MCVYDVSVCVCVCLYRCHNVDMEVKRHSSVNPPCLNEGHILVACYCIGQVNWLAGFRVSPISIFHFTVTALEGDITNMSDLYSFI